MLAHLQGTVINASKLASNLDVSNPTINRYIDLLCDLLLVRRINPWHNNTKKRLIKSPRVYIRDSGLLHQLLNITNYEALLSHPLVGASWEGFVIENIISALPQNTKYYFFHAVSGAEIDLIIEFSNIETWAIEIKRSSAPKIKRGFYSACKEINPQQKFVIYNGTESFPLPNGVTAMPLAKLLQLLI